MTPSIIQLPVTQLDSSATYGLMSQPPRRARRAGFLVGLWSGFVFCWRQDRQTGGGPGLRFGLLWWSGIMYASRTYCVRTHVQPSTPISHCKINVFVLPIQLDLLW